jgi:hypothetical protein
MAERTPWDERRIGMAVVGHGNDWDAGGPNVYLSSWWFHEHWGRLFEIVDVREGRAPGEHTLALLRRRPVTLTKAEVEAAAPGDEREVAALQTQVALLRRDVRLLRERRRAELARLETSLSWRLTAPLRKAAAAARSARAPLARRAGRG